MHISFVCEYAVQLYTEDFHCGNLRKKWYKSVVGNLEYGFPVLQFFEVKHV